MGLGNHLQIKPDTDAYLLAAMLTEIDRLGRWDDDVLARHARNGVDELRESSPFDADSVAAVTGLSADDIRLRRRRVPLPLPPRSRTWDRREHGSAGHARLLVAADAQPHDRQSRPPRWRLLAALAPAHRASTSPDRFFDSLSGRSDTRKATCLPTRCPSTCTPSALASALIVVGGNPIMAVPGEERLREAFPHLVSWSRWICSGAAPPRNCPTTCCR